MAETVGTIQVVATINTSGYESGKRQIEKGNSELQSSTESGVNKLSSVITGAVAGIVATVVNKGIDVIVSSVSSAIDRVDTLNNSVKVFENLGFATSDVNNAMDALNDAILGLPTSLDDAVSGMQLLAMQSGDIEDAEKSFKAMNDAVLASGGSTYELNNAIQQFTQIDLSGPLDAQTWNSLRNDGLAPAMKMMASMSGRTMGQLKEAFSDGTLTGQDFLDMLQKLDTDGTGSIASLSSQSKDMTSGIETGMANASTAVTRGIADIIKSIGSENISGWISGIGKSTEKTLKSISEFVGWMQKAGGEQDSIKALAAVFGSFIGLVVGLATAFKVAAIAQSIFDLAIKGSSIGTIIILIASLVAGLVYFFTQTETGQKIWSSFTKFLSDSIGTAYKKIKSVFDDVKAVFDDVIKNATDTFESIRDTIVGAFKDAFDTVSGFIDDHKDVIGSIAIVITSLLIPKIIAVGIQWGITAAQAVASFAVMSAGAIANAAKTTSAWVVSAAKSVASFIVNLPKIIAQFVLTSASAIANAAIVVASWIAAAATTAASWVASMATVIAGFIAAGAQALVTALGIAADWLLALGPVGLLIAAITAIVGVFIWLWNTNEGFRDFMMNAWNGIVSFFQSIPGTIQNSFSSLTNWFKNLWNGIVGIFRSVGGAIGNAIGGAFEAAINGYMNTVGNIVNGVISAINGAIKTINKIPGVNIGKISKIPIPQLAEGGIVSSPTLAMIGEGGESEAVIPLSKLDDITGNSGSSSSVNIEVNMSGIMTSNPSDERAIAKRLINRVNEELRAKNKPQIGVA